MKKIIKKLACSSFLLLLGICVFAQKTSSPYTSPAADNQSKSKVAPTNPRPETVSPKSLNSSGDETQKEPQVSAPAKPVPIQADKKLETVSIPENTKSKNLKPQDIPRPATILPDTRKSKDQKPIPSPVIVTDGH